MARLFVRNKKGKKLLVTVPSGGCTPQNIEAYDISITSNSELISV